MSLTTAYALMKPLEQKFRCPLCGASFVLGEQGSFVCTKGHCYDLSAKGYINFLPQQRGGKYTKDLFESRRFLFERGIYDGVADAVSAALGLWKGEAMGAVLDAGCGEGFYAKRIHDQYPETPVMGMDIEKDAVLLAAKGGQGVCWMVADLANLPLQDASLSGIVNILTPANYGEFCRVLRDDGLLVKVLPGPDYCKELRERFSAPEKAVYSNQRVLDHLEQHMTVIKRTKVYETAPLTPAESDAFVRMSPLLFGLDRSCGGQEALSQITLDLEVVTARKGL